MENLNFISPSSKLVVSSKFDIPSERLFQRSLSLFFSSFRASFWILAGFPVKNELDFVSGRNPTPSSANLSPLALWAVFLVSGQR